VRPSRGRRQSGFALLLALLVLLVTGTLLTIAARRSCHEAMLASQAQRDLEITWGARSVSALCLNDAGRMLAQGRMEDTHTSACVHRTFILGPTTFEALVSDEQAKANVNRLAAKTGGDLGSRLRALQSDLSSPLPARAAAGRTVAGPGRTRVQHSSLEDVLEVAHPSQLVDLDNPPGGVGRLTCWGDGKVNFKRADDVVLKEMLDGVLTQTQVEEALAYRRQAPDCTLGELLTHLQLTLDRRAQAASALTDTSSCHSVWVVAQGTTRKWYFLYVSKEAPAPAKPERWSYAW